MEPVPLFDVDVDADDDVIVVERPGRPAEQIELPPIGEGPTSPIRVYAAAGSIVKSADGQTLVTVSEDEPGDVEIRVQRVRRLRAH